MPRGELEVAFSCTLRADGATVLFLVVFFRLVLRHLLVSQEQAKHHSLLVYHWVAVKISWMSGCLWARGVLLRFLPYPLCFLFMLAFRGFSLVRRVFLE